jgi:hypothetical protein
MTYTERRHSPRSSLYIWGILRLAGQAHPGTVLDISGSGALFRAAYPLPAESGNTCKLELVRAGQSGLRVATARIAHQRRTLFGLAFTELGVDTWQLLNDFASRYPTASKLSTVSGDKAVHYPVDRLLHDTER